eukprot:GFKZ01011316.1.p1 GENE.GFKZ01011316.1~~GFKZ01011316.1.p1  ORF type:complete len:279 (+),score=73.01 GFKZ01011316.1:263-1099(+)
MKSADASPAFTPALALPLSPPSVSLFPKPLTRASPPLHHRPCSRRVIFRASDSPTPPPSHPNQPTLPALPPFFKASFISLAVLSTVLTPLPSLRRRFAPQGAAAVSAAMRTSSNVVRESSTSDVEAAAMTLGAVTLGGLFMRVILSRSRDEKREQERVAAECQRLEEEEQQRMLRRERKRMESVEASEVEGDSGLMDELRKRVESMEEQSDVKDTDAKELKWGNGGMGSAVLERPDSGATESSDSGERGGGEDVEMLKRMWDMSSEGDGGKKGGAADK